MSPAVSVNTTDKTRLVLVLAVAFFLVGGGLTVYGIGEYRAANAMLDDLVEVEATIVDSEIQPYENGRPLDDVSERRMRNYDEWDDDVTFRLAVAFEYEFEGQRYRSSNFDVAGAIPTYDEFEDAREAVRDYPEGERTSAYVHPDEPGEAYLEGDMPLAVYGTIGFGVLLLVGAIWLPVAQRLGIGRSG